MEGDLLLCVMMHPLDDRNMNLFQGYWMSDKPVVQQALSSELAELILIIPSNSLSLAFLRGFWEAIAREWGGIDRLRYDLFLSV